MKVNNIVWVEMFLNPNVPPNTECTVLIENVSSEKALHAGVRKKGSSLNRKIIIPPKTSIQMKVTTDNNSKIETFAEDMEQIRFKIKF